MRIACDLDGVLYDYHGAACYLLNTHKGTNLRWEDWGSWGWINDVSSREDREWLMTEGIRLGLFRYGHVIKGGIVGIQQLNERGHEVVFVTHRPAGAVQSTLDFLSYARLDPAAVHILSNQEPKTTIAADVYVDDKPEVIADVMVNTSSHAILFSRPWNADRPIAGDRDRRFFRANGWQEVVERVSQIG